MYITSIFEKDFYLEDIPDLLILCSNKDMK